MKFIVTTVHDHAVNNISFSPSLRGEMFRRGNVYERSLPAEPCSGVGHQSSTEINPGLPSLPVGSWAVLNFLMRQHRSWFSEFGGSGCIGNTSYVAKQYLSLRSIRECKWFDCSLLCGTNFTEDFFFLSAMHYYSQRDFIKHSLHFYPKLPCVLLEVEAVDLQKVVHNCDLERINF